MTSATFVLLGFGTVVARYVFSVQGEYPPPGQRSHSVQYTFVGEDYPAYYPLDMDEVSLTPEFTIHYQVSGETAEREWASILPEGGGFLHLGAEERPFGITLFHQLSCLQRLRRAIDTGDASAPVHRCMNYLRQSILCEANPTIEPVIPILGGWTVDAKFPRVCKDWTQVYMLAEKNYAEGVGVGQRDMKYY
ncbi:hypothetical protein C8Q70DRAFT_1050464 [Cubamyces menziesii]|nr:hypothetical protein C8Q70DRAFT_1050464 [Cubamyces menziesii]